MTPSRFRDVCLVQSLNIRGALSAARVGHPGHGGDVEAYEKQLSVWQDIEQAGSFEALSPEQKAVFEKATTGSV